MIIPIPDSAGFAEPDRWLLEQLRPTVERDMREAGLLREKWSDEARHAAIAARRAAAKHKTKKDKRIERERGQDPLSDRAGSQRLAAHARGEAARRAAGTRASFADAANTYGKKQAEKAKQEAGARAERKKAEAKGGGGKDDGTPKRQGESTNDQGERVVKYSDGSTVTVHKDGSATRKKADGTEVKGKYKDPEPKEKEPEGFKGETQADRDRAAKKADTDRKRTEREQATAARKSETDKKNAERDEDTKRKRAAHVRAARSVNIRRQRVVGAARRTAARYEATYERRR